jgi:thiol:disulfide interchange protein DsbA
MRRIKQMIKYVLSMVLFCMPMLAMSADYIEGQDYEVIQGANAATHKGGHVHVTEFFSYGCPWCYRLDAAVAQWVVGKGRAIQFSRVPVVFHTGWDNYARAYYLIDSLSLGKTVHDKLFKAIIVDKQPLTRPQDMIAFFTTNGVDATLADSAFSYSPSIELRLKADAALMAQYQMNAVPTLVVNRQYKTNLQMAKSEVRLFAIANYLVDKVNKE